VHVPDEGVLITVTLDFSSVKDPPGHSEDAGPTTVSVKVATCVPIPRGSSSRSSKSCTRRDSSGSGGPPGIRLLVDGRNATSAANWAGTPRIVLGTGSG
jgi:hypothetical protein